MNRIPFLFSNLFLLKFESLIAKCTNTKSWGENRISFFEPRNSKYEKTTRS